MKRLVMPLVVAILLSGCMSTMKQTVTTKYGKDGSVISITKVIESESGPLIDKGVKTRCKAAGLEFTLFDPTTGSYTPSGKIIYGDSGVETLPVTMGGQDPGVFGTVSETFTYDKSLWGAEIGSMTYSRQAGGTGVSAIPSVTIVTSASSGTALLPELKTGEN